jgi:hypothetical protein
MIAVVDRWARHFGYYDNRIDLTNGDLSSFTTGDASLTAHAPLWGTKEGEEEAVPVAEVRRRLARLLRFARAHRHNLHLALHPDGTQLCLFFELKPRLRVLSIPLRTVTMAFVVLATETADGVRITAIHEWDAADPQAAAKVVINEHGWPADTTLNPHQGFGAAS